MQKKFKTFTFKLPGCINTIRGNINAGNKKSVLSQDPAMAPLSTGYIQHQAAGLGFQVFQQLQYKPAGFKLIPFKIKFVIERGVKPIFKPGFF